MREIIDLSKKKFGRLQPINIIKKEKINNSNIIWWECVCDCGNVVIVRAGNLRSGNSTSCGCYAAEEKSRVHKKYNQYNLSGEYGIGYTSNNSEFYFDLEDYETIKYHCWFIEKGNGYISSNIKYGTKIKVIRMQNLIMNNASNKEIVIDHINRNRVDNRKKNLRHATQRQNGMNVSLSSRNTSGVMGVYWDKNRNKWCSQVTIMKKHIYLGRYESFNDAIKARLLAEKEYFGEFSPQIHLFEQYGV